MAENGAENVRAIFDQAEDIPPWADPAGGPPAPAEGGPPRRFQAGPPWHLPDDAPVVPLGIADDMHYYLDASQQLRAIKAKDHSRLNVMALFGKRRGYLYDHWPRYSKDGKIVTGWAPEAAAEALMAACSENGVWDVVGRVRGPGGWIGEEGELVFHCGNLIWRGVDRIDRPGTLANGGRYVYPAAAETPRPAEDRQAPGEGGPAHALLELLKSWNWKRGETDALLLLGWIGAALLGGALRWRPLVWITGDKATGKSTLHDVVKGAIGSILASSDATAAGIWQLLGHASLPVALDEVEAKDDNRRAQAVIELARQAASGGVVMRGGADHQGSQFTARSCFMFSSILIPPLLGQDVSRMALLELEPLTTTAPPALATNPKALRELGRALRRRLADGWADFPGRLETWRQQLAAAGHNGRGADQFGTLLACADILLYDDAPDSEALEGWTAQLTPRALSAQADDAPDHERCLHRLLSSPADLYRGGARESIAWYVRRAAGMPGNPMDEKPGSDAVFEADRVLGNLGLRVESIEGARWLAVANTHQGLTGVFAGTHWEGRSGSTPAYVQSLRRAKGARPLSDFKDGKGRGRVTMRFGGVPCRATLVPLETVFPDESETPPEDPGGAAAGGEF